MATKADLGLTSSNFIELQEILINQAKSVGQNLRNKLDAVDGGYDGDELGEILLMTTLAIHSLIELDQSIMGIQPQKAQQDAKAVSLMTLDHLKSLKPVDDADNTLLRVKKGH